jgi:hypothetical protein
VRQARRALDILEYNTEKVAFEREMTAVDNGWIPMVGYYDAVRSLTALRVLLQIIC